MADNRLRFLFRLHHAWVDAPLGSALRGTYCQILLSVFGLFRRDPCFAVSTTIVLSFARHEIVHPIPGAPTLMILAPLMRGTGVVMNYVPVPIGELSTIHYTELPLWKVAFHLFRGNVTVIPLHLVSRSPLFWDIHSSQAV